MANNKATAPIAALKRIWSFKKQEDGTIIITGYKGGDTEIAVPEKIGGGTVSAIGHGAFCPFAARITPDVKEVRKAVTSIVLPDAVRVIEKGAFWDCEALASVNIPEGVEKIAENTFADCKSLENIVIPKSVKVIERRAFFNCGALTVTEMPENVKAIGDSAFGQCGGLELTVRRGSETEKYCKAHNIKFKYKDGE